MPVRPWTSRMRAAHTLLIAMPASSRLDDESWPPRVAAPITTNRITTGAGERAGPDADDAGHHVPVERDGEHGAERRAGRDAQRVGRGERVAQHRLEQAARQRQRTAREKAEQRP